jgi:SAM-dependent methyltransferase
LKSGIRASLSGVRDEKLIAAVVVPIGADIRDLRSGIMDEHQAIWDARYERVRREERTIPGEPWLDAWLGRVPARDPKRALDVGCGSGHNARLLLDRGFDVTAIDFAPNALELCRREAPGARTMRVDVRNGLPFDDHAYELVVADLSLHYFPWATTTAVARDIERCLVPGGLLAARFNSTGDVRYGADSGSPIGGDPRLRAVRGIEKRFFTEECVRRLFGPPWRIESLEEKTTLRFGEPKVLWELVASMPPPPD